MMKNKKSALVALPLFFTFGHALESSATAVSLPEDSVKECVVADSVKRMMRDGVSLGEVVVSGSSNKEMQMKSSLNVMRADRRFIEENFSGSLMQTLSRLPGVQAMNVGSGESKPVIRGLGFNRVLVAENGIKHESQQWGDDHGLEVRLSDIDYDRSRRDIDLRCHTINHFMVANHTDCSWADGMLEGNFAYQNNRQRELAEPVSHGYMPIPSGTIERSSPSKPSRQV